MDIAQTAPKSGAFGGILAPMHWLDFLLGPFHLEAENWTSRTKDDHALILEDGDPLEFNMGDLRAIAKLYEEVR